MRPNTLMPIMIFMTIFFNICRSFHRFFSVTQFQTILLRVVLILSVTAAFTSCKKELLSLGTDILPAGDIVSIKGSDSISVTSYTYYDDSTRTDNPFVSFLGQDTDRYFGTTTADFVTQIRLGQEWPTDSLKIDSVKLYLHFLSIKGGASDEVHYLRFSEIANQIYTDQPYYSIDNVQLSGYVSPDLPLPLTLNKDTLNVALDVPLEFAKHLIRDRSMLFYSNNKPDFRSYFKGLYFQILPDVDPVMLSISVAPPASLGNFYNSFVFYMHDTINTSESPVTYPIILDATNKNAAYNRFKHDFTTATKGDRMIHRNTTFRDQLSYVQSLNGVYTKVVLPGLEKIKDDPSFDRIAVNRARLIVPVFWDSLPGQYISKTLPLSLLMRYSDNGTKFFVPDYVNSSTDVSHSFFDGTLDTINKQYKFNIPAFVQKYLDDETGHIKPELEIFQTTGTQNVIFEANNKQIPVKFDFTYTEF